MAHKVSRKAVKAQKNIPKVEKQKKKRKRKDGYAFYIEELLEKDHPGIEFSRFAIDVIKSFASHYYFLGDSIQAALELQFPILDVAKKAAVSKNMKSVMHLLPTR